MTWKPLYRCGVAKITQRTACNGRVLLLYRALSRSAMILNLGRSSDRGRERERDVLGQLNHFILLRGLVFPEAHTYLSGCGLTAKVAVVPKSDYA